MRKGKKLINGKEPGRKELSAPTTEGKENLVIVNLTVMGGV